MHGCEKYAEMISALVDGELSADDLRALTEHISACDGCRRLYNAFMELGEGMRFSSAAPPSDLTSAVMEKINARSDEEERIVLKKRPRWVRYGALAACLALFVYAGVRVLPRGAGSPPPAKDMASQASAEELRELPESAASGAAAPPFAQRDTTDEGTVSGALPSSMPQEGSANEYRGGINALVKEMKLFETQKVELFSNISYQPMDPILTSISQETLDALFALLDFSVTDSFKAHDLEPAFVMKLWYLSGAEFDLKIWVIDGVLFSNSPDGQYYVAACNMDDFLVFIIQTAG